MKKEVWCISVILSIFLLCFYVGINSGLNKFHDKQRMLFFISEVNDEILYNRTISFETKQLEIENNWKKYYAFSDSIQNLNIHTCRVFKD